MIFTSSNPLLANKIVDQIDQQGELFKARLFKKDCYHSKNGIFIKDLRILARDPRSTVLVDNNSYSYGFQLFNGVPILPYNGNDDDREMLFLQAYLDHLKDKQDVRIVNKYHFKYHLYKDDITINELKTKLFN